MGDKKTILIAGYGTVGKSLKPLLDKAGHKVFTVDLKTDRENIYKIFGQHFDIIHICFPCENEDEFVNQVLKYEMIYTPKEYIIINSTVPLLTCEIISENRVYSKCKIIHMPVRGVELYKEGAFTRYINFIGPAIPYEMYTELEKYIRNLKIPFEWLPSSRESALGKIVGTTWYGMLIAFANQTKIICDIFNIDFYQAYTRSMGTDKIGREYFKINEDDTKERAQTLYEIERPVNVPGVIGGHCIMPNLKFIEEYAPNFVDWIDEMHWAMKDTKKLMEEELNEK
jgi:UDP-glucose 6-dehydrogenase